MAVGLTVLVVVTAGKQLIRGSERIEVLSAISGKSAPLYISHGEYCTQLTAGMKAKLR